MDGAVVSGGFGDPGTGGERPSRYWRLAVILRSFRESTVTNRAARTTNGGARPSAPALGPYYCSHLYMKMRASLH